MLFSENTRPMTGTTGIHSGCGPAWLHRILAPGAYAGYHIHEGNEEIHYVLAGEGEYAQEGEHRRIRPGDATLVKSGQAHGIKNTAAENLCVLAIGTASKEGQLGARNIGLPGFLKDWAE